MTLMPDENPTEAGVLSSKPPTVGNQMPKDYIQTVILDGAHHLTVLRTVLASGEGSWAGCLILVKYIPRSDGNS